MASMVVERLAEGLWRWTAPHPEWREGEDWDRVVGSVYLEAPGAVVLFDPLVPAGSDGERFWRALDRDVDRLARPVAVLLTCRWHVRSAGAVRDRYEARVWAPSPEGAGFAGVVTDAVGDGEWPVEGVQAFLTGMPGPEDEAVYWVPGHRAIVPGDVLLGGGRAGVRLAPPAWYSDGAAERAWYESGLRPSLGRLVALDPDMVLVAHGNPVTRGGALALAAALEVDGS